MTHANVKIRKVGGSAGMILPKEVLDELQVEVGDTLHLVRTERGYELTPYDPEFEEAMELYRQVARDYRDALRELSK